jgi:Viral BACON domain
VLGDSRRITGPVWSFTTGAGTSTTLLLDKPSLRFGATTTGTTFASQTGPQVVRLTQHGSGTVTWTASPTQPWIRITPASGTGSASLSISVVGVGGLPLTGTVSGAVRLNFNGAASGVSTIDVTLNLVPTGSSVSPFGSIDTPTDFRTGVTGAIPVTGWALDDIEVTRVMICRSAVGPEVAAVDPNCGGTAQIFVGFAAFIDGARPDVAAAFPMSTMNLRAGWGFMLLTNTLPNQGNGTYVFHVWAEDREGRAVPLGSRTMTCSNATATLPFGAIETPTQGGVRLERVSSTSDGR